MNSKKKIGFGLVGFLLVGALAWGAGNTNPILQAFSIKNGSGLLNINTSGTVTIANGTGTLGLNPMTTLGDMTYGGASGANTRLAGDTSNVAVFLSELSSGGVATAETWKSSTGTGNVVLSASPTLTGTIGAASETLSGTLNVTGVATFTAQPIASSLTASQAIFTDASKGLVSNAISGTGNVAMTTNPVFTTPNLGTPSALVGTNISGTAASLTAGLATALVNNPTDCGANTYATTIDASGNLTCASITNASTTGVTASTASTLALRDSNGNAAFVREKNDYTTTVTASQTTTLTAASTKIQFFTGSTAGQIVKLPATNAAGMNGTGEQFFIRNTSTQTVAIQDSSGGAIATEAADSLCTVTELTAGSPGTWNSQCSVNGAGGGTVTSVAMTVPTGFAVSGTPVTTSGTLAVTLSNETARTFFQGPLSGSAAAPTFAALTAPTIQTFTSTGTQTGWLFTVTSANATVGATYTNNSNTYTILTTISGGTLLLASGTGATSGGTLTKATGSGDASITFSSKVSLATYTAPTNPPPLYIKFRMIGGGGGGGGSATSGAGGTGGTGGNSVFSVSTALGGVGGPGGNAGGVGGTASLGSGVSGTATTGNQGGSGSAETGTADVAEGGDGAPTIFGGNGGGGYTGGGLTAVANSGAGGGGAGITSTLLALSGSGGGAAGLVQGYIASPAATYPYVIGAAGTAGLAGTNGIAGGGGGSGYIEVVEYYQ